MKTRLLALAVLLATLSPIVAAKPDNGFVAHEWGAFTSVQGADGVQMGWNPLVVSELPKFVYDRSRVRLKGVPFVAGKAGMVCRQRMETPVIYFYSDRARTVDVSVQFPAGSVTEWYPQESAANLRISVNTSPLTRKLPALQWRQAQILPPTAASLPLPMDATGSHYYAARETDAALLRTTDNKKTEVEKFLFYRGVGDFLAPLTVKLESADATRMTLNNSGQEELRDLFVYEVRADGGIAWTPVEKLAAGETRSVSVGEDSSAGAQALAAALRAGLVREGLYEKEAAAMVKTWESSWLGERGLRVLYTLPRAWTDRTLPLAITPAPKSVERVMVGRAEIITPAMEVALLREVERYLAAKPEDRRPIVADTRALGYGRFTEAVLRRLTVGVERSREFHSLSWELLQASTAKPEQLQAGE